MQRLPNLPGRAATLWRSGRRGKLTVGCGGLAAVVGLCLCSLLAWAQSPGGQSAAATGFANQTATRQAAALLAPTVASTLRATDRPPTQPPALPTIGQPNPTAPVVTPTGAILQALATSLAPPTRVPTTPPAPTRTPAPPTQVPPTRVPPTQPPPVASSPPTPQPTLGQAARPAPVQPTQAPPPPTQAAPTGDAFSLSVRNQGAGLETVTVTNNGAQPQAMGGWRILSYSGQCVLQGDQTFTFPAGFTLAVGASVNVYSGYRNNPPGDGLRARSDNIWDNDADLAELVRPDGTLVTRYGYGRCR